MNEFCEKGINANIMHTVNKLLISTNFIDASTLSDIHTTTHTQKHAYETGTKYTTDAPPTHAF